MPTLPDFFLIGLDNPPPSCLTLPFEKNVIRTDRQTDGQSGQTADNASGRRHRSDTITMCPFHRRDLPRGQFAERPAIPHVAISAFIHRVHLSICHFILFSVEFSVMSGRIENMTGP